MTSEMTTVSTGQLAVTDESLVDRWIRYIDVSEKSAATYTRNIRPFLLYCSSIGKVNPADVTREDIISYRQKLDAEGKKAATVSAYLAAVRVFFKWLTAEGLVAENPAEHVKGKKVTADHRSDYLSVNRCTRLLNAIDTETVAGKRDYAMIILSLTTGLRTISLSLANVEDIRTMGEDDEWYLFYQGKGHEDKDTPVRLIEPVYQAIQDYLTARGSRRDTEPLFASRGHQNAGQRMTTRAISGIIKEHLKEAGMDNSRLTAHSLRHTAATLAFEAGASLTEVQQMMNHESPLTTQRYLNELNRKKNQCENLIGEAIFSAC